MHMVRHKQRRLRMHADCTFVNLGGIGVDSPNGCDDCSSAINVQSTASVHVVNSTFSNAVPGNGSSYVNAWDAGSAALLSGCRFDNATSRLRQRGGAQVYSDDTSLRVETGNGRVVAPQLPSEVPEVAKGQPPVFQTRDNAWFVSVVKVRRWACV